MDLTEANNHLEKDMSIIDQLLKEASESPVDKWDTQFACCDIDGKRLALTIQHFPHGGDGQVNRLKTRKEWVWDGKNISIEALKKTFSQ